jgi:hypothetical protein
MAKVLTLLAIPGPSRIRVIRLLLKTTLAKVLMHSYLRGAVFASRTSGHYEWPDSLCTMNNRRELI